VKQALFLMPLLLLSASASADDPTQKCDLRDQRSICEVRLTVQELNIINNAFENAPIPHANWGPVWDDITRQVMAQQGKPRDERK